MAKPRKELYSLIIELRREQATTREALNHLIKMIGLLERKLGVGQNEGDNKKNLGGNLSQEIHRSGAAFR